MRLPGHIAAAIDVLTDIETRHRPASEALGDWGRAHRFAGSGDRAAIGNIVHDALRRRASIAWRMQGDTPWHLAVGAAVLAAGGDARAVAGSFAGDDHAPAPVPEAIIARFAAGADIGEAPAHVRADIPEFLSPQFEAAFGAVWVAEGEGLAARPPLDLRVNTLKTTREKVAQHLARLGAEPTPYSPVGLRIPPAAGPRRHPNVQAEEAYRRGRVEIQDEGSQIAALLVGAKPGEQVLDYCAGGGGKTLAVAGAMENRGQIYAYDADRNRLAPIYERLQRAGARNVQVRAPAEDVLDELVGRMDRVVVDAPCSGSGAWRRRPDTKWRLTPRSLASRVAEQEAVMAAAAGFVRPGGALAYITCSVLPEENEAQIARFLSAGPDFEAVAVAEAWCAAFGDIAPPPEALAAASMLTTPRRAGTDGFFFAMLRRR